MEDVATAQYHKECGEFQLTEMDAKESETETWYEQRDTGKVKYVEWFPR